MLGIDLGGDGVTLNDDSDDSDAGPNELQNYPSVRAALSESLGTRVRGTLKTKLGIARYVLDFYANSEADPSGFGEGQRWLGSVEVSTDEDGVAQFNALLDELTAPDEFVTATATDKAGNTSEFSPARAIVAALPGGSSGSAPPSSRQPSRRRAALAGERRALAPWSIP